MAEPKRIRWEGALDMGAVPEFVAAVQALFEAGVSVEVDLSGVQFIDSTGVAGLLNLRRTAAGQRAALRFEGFQPDVAEILEIMGVAGLINN